MCDARSKSAGKMRARVKASMRFPPTPAAEQEGREGQFPPPIPAAIALPMTASPTTSPTTNSDRTIVPVSSGPCTSTLAILLARTALRAESADGLPDRFVQTRLSPTITGWLAVNCVRSWRVRRTRSGLESALNRCGCNDVVCHAVQAVKNVQATSRATADTNSCCGGRGRISSPGGASAPRGLWLLSAFQYAPWLRGRNHWSP